MTIASLRSRGCDQAHAVFEAKGPGALEAATAHAAAAIAARHGHGEVSARIQAHVITAAAQAPAGACQFTRVQVWPPQNMPPKAQPCTRSALVPISAIVES